MCGIVGWYATSMAEGPAPDLQRLDRATDRLASRGPDGRGTWISEDGRCGLGHRRLSIIDLEGGAQPMATPDGRWHLSFNGEIFNYQELRRDLVDGGTGFRTQSDTEVLLEALRRDGAAAVRGLQGQFAFAAYDSSERQLLLARDALGEKPLFTAMWKGRLFFASTLDALLELGEMSREPDPEAVSHFLAFSYIPAPWTAFRCARKLPAGHLLTASPRGVWAPETWWIPPRPGAFEGSYEDAVDALHAALGEATKRRMIADVPLGAFLSGGLDSTAVVAAAKRAAGGIRAFTIRHPDPRFDESREAAAIAAHLGVEHEILDAEPTSPEDLSALFRLYGEPFADSSAAVTRAIAAAARRQVTVALTGDGGDEILGGYHRHAYLAMIDAVPSAPSWLRNSTGGRIRRALELSSLPEERRYYAMYECFPSGARAALLLPEFTREFGEAPRDWLEGLYRSSGGADVVDRMLRTDLRTHLPDFMNTKVDVATMAEGLEARSPFQELSVVELGLSFPSSFKVRGFRGKRVLRDVVRRDVPDSLLATRKRGFAAPVDEALRGPLRERAEELLAPDGPLASLQAIRPEVPPRLFQEHIDGSAQHRIRVWVLLSLAAWLEGEAVHGR